MNEQTHGTKKKQPKMKGVPTQRLNFDSVTNTSMEKHLHEKRVDHNFIYGTCYLMTQ